MNDHIHNQKRPVGRPMGSPSINPSEILLGLLDQRTKPITRDRSREGDTEGAPTDILEAQEANEGPIKILNHTIASSSDVPQPLNKFIVVPNNQDPVHHTVSPDHEIHRTSSCNLSTQCHCSTKEWNVIAA